MHAYRQLPCVLYVGLVVVIAFCTWKSGRPAKVETSDLIKYSHFHYLVDMPTCMCCERDAARLRACPCGAAFYHQRCIMTVLPEALTVTHPGCSHSFNRVRREWVKSRVPKEEDLTFAVQSVDDVNDCVRIVQAWPNTLIIKKLLRGCTVNVFAGALQRRELTGRFAGEPRSTSHTPRGQLVDSVVGGNTFRVTFDTERIAIDAPSHTVIVDTAFDAVNDRAPKLGDIGRRLLSWLY